MENQERKGGKGPISEEKKAEVKSYCDGVRKVKEVAKLAGLSCSAIYKLRATMALNIPLEEIRRVRGKGESYHKKPPTVA